MSTVTHKNVEREARCPEHGEPVKRFSHSSDGTVYADGSRDRRFFLVYACNCRGVVVGYAGNPIRIESTAPVWAQSENW